MPDPRSRPDRPAATFSGVDREPFILLQTGGPGPATVQGAVSCRLGSADGPHLGWSWDGERLALEIDRYGMYPGYCFEQPGRFGLSPSIPQLLQLGAPTGLDDAALAVFLRLGFFLGEDTPFRGIRAVPPCTSFEWRAEGLSVSPRRPEFRSEPVGRREAVEAYIRLFHRAVRRRLPEGRPYSMPLSGGMDSRHILLELTAAGCPPRACVTLEGHPTTSRGDVEVAGRLARELGLTHLLLRQPGFSVQRELDKNLRLNFCTMEYSWSLPLADYFLGRDEPVYDGIGGDVLSSGLFLTEEKLRLFARGRLVELAEHLLSDTRERRLRAYLRPASYARFSREAAVRRLVRELDGQAGSANPVTSFYFRNRTRRSIAMATCRLFPTARPVHCPYLDPDLFDFLSSLPPSLTLDGRLHLETIHRAFPEQARIPFAAKSRSTGAYSLTGSRSVRLRAALDLLRYLGRDLGTLAGRPFLAPRIVRSFLGARYAVESFCIPVLYLAELERLARR